MPSPDETAVPEFQMLVLFRQALELQLERYRRRKRAEGEALPVDIPDPLVVDLMRSAFDAEDEQTIHSLHNTLETLDGATTLASPLDTPQDSSSWSQPQSNVGANQAKQTSQTWDPAHTGTRWNDQASQ